MHQRLISLIDYFLVTVWWIRVATETAVPRLSSRPIVHALACLDQAQGGERLGLSPLPQLY